MQQLQNSIQEIILQVDYIDLKSFAINFTIYLIFIFLHVKLCSLFPIFVFIAFSIIQSGEWRGKVLCDSSIK